MGRFQAERRAAAAVAQRRRDRSERKVRRRSRRSLNTPKVAERYFADGVGLAVVPVELAAVEVTGSPLDDAGVGAGVGAGVRLGVGEGVGRIQLIGSRAQMSVALCPARDSVIAPVAMNLLLEGSKISAVDSGLYSGSHPPASRTVPSGNSVAECPERPSIIFGPGMNLPDAGS